MTIPAPKIEFTASLIAQAQSEIGWTPLRRAYVKELYELGGHSCAEIAARVGGGITRNAVIGILHRMSVAKTLRKTNKALKRKRTPAPKPTRVVKLSVNWHAPRFDLHPQHSASSIDVPTDKKVTMAALENHHCKYPLGDAHDPVEHFCGQDKMPGVSYCLGHVRMCFQPPQPRRVPGHGQKPLLGGAGTGRDAFGGVSGQNPARAAGDALEVAE